MQKKQMKFADDGWAVWIDGDDTSTVYLNDWLNPKGKSYIDIAIRIRGVTTGKYLYVYVPFAIGRDEIEDVSLLFSDTKILQATFSAGCIVDYKKNEHTSEVAYNGKTIDIVHISTLEYQTTQLSKGTLIGIDLSYLHAFLDNDEAYFIWRMPHKTLDAIFKNQVNVGKMLDRLRDLITSPVVSEKYGYAIEEDYEINDTGCYRIRRLEENLYKGYLPLGYDYENVITYQWNQNREYNLQGQFNFYYSIAKNSISRGSMFLYMLLLLVISIFSDIISTFVKILLGLA